MPFLDRPLFDDRIRAALRDGSVALHGSLEYGKTTLLRSALRELDAPVARYEARPGSGIASRWRWSTRSPCARPS